MLALLLFLACTAMVQAQSLPRGMVGRDVVMPLYSDAATEPCALIRIGKLHRDYQTRGFFRIGVLPMVRAEHVEIEIIRPDQTRVLLQQAQSSLLGLNRSDVAELRGLRVRFTGDTEPRLTAQRARISKDGAWHLEDAATLRRGHEPVVLPRCRLVVHGSDAGSLLVNTSGGVTRHSIFPETEPVSSNPTPEEKP